MEPFEHFLRLCPASTEHDTDEEALRAAHRAMRDLATDAPPSNLRWSLADRRADDRRR